jgi:tetratricopeptide (TPR) repeat protein
MSDFEENFDANFYLGEAYRAQDKYAEAIYRYQKALKIQEDEPRALKSIAWSYYKIRFYSEALTTAQKILKISPTDEQAPIIMARTLLKLKKTNEALSTLKKAMGKAGKESQPYYLSVIAEALAAQGKTNDALESWRKALKIQPLLAGALLGSGQALFALNRKEDAIDYLERAVRLKPKMYEGHYWMARSLEDSNPSRALRYYNHFRRNGSNDPEFVELVQDAKKRTASIQTRINMEKN